MLILKIHHPKNLKKLLIGLKIYDWDLFFFGYMSCLGFPIDFNILKT